MRRFLFYSLALNLMFFGLSGVFIYRRGGYSYLIGRFAPASRADARSTRFIDSPVYLGRNDTFTKLPPPKEAELVFIGDSLVDFCNWGELLERPALNRGIGGDTVEGLRRRVDQVLQHRPGQLFVMIGINDLLSGKSSDQVLAEYLLLINQIRTASPPTQIFLQSILPVTTAARLARNAGSWDEVNRNVVRVNNALSNRADGKQIIYVDLYSKMVANANQLDLRYTSDGVHLNGEGYLKWRDVVRPLCKKRDWVKPSGGANMVTRVVE